MGSTSLLKVQIAMIDALKGNTTLNDKVGGRIYDEVPNTEVFPFIAIGSHTEEIYNTFDRFGREAVITINIWSQYKGYKEALEILELINQTLDYQNISITDNDLVYIRYDDSSTIREPDGRTRQIAARFRVITQEV